MIKIENFLQNNNEKLRIKFYCLTTEDIIYIDKYISTSHNLHTLVLSSNQITMEKIQYLSQAIYNFKYLYKLKIAHNSIEKNMLSLSNGISNCKFLHTLHLGGNHIGNNVDNIKYLTKAILNCKFLHTLNLEGNGINSEGLKYLCQALPECKFLRQINLSRNNFGIQGSYYFSQVLNNNTTLSVLHLNDIRINLEGIKYLANSISACTTLHTFYFTHNCLIGTKGMKDILEGLSHCSSLSKLVLNNNPIETKEGIIGKYISQIMSKCPLYELYLSNNNINCESIKYISYAIENCPTLYTLNLANNCIRCDGVKYIFKKIISENHSLHNLYLNDNYISWGGINYIAKVIPKCYYLHTLYFGKNHTKSFSNIIKALENNISIEETDIYEIKHILTKENLQTKRNKYRMKSARK